MKEEESAAKNEKFESADWLDPSSILLAIAVVLLALFAWRLWQ